MVYIEVINKAEVSRNITKPLVMHCDRVIQYTCPAYQKAIEESINKYSKKAYPWDNACI